MKTKVYTIYEVPGVKIGCTSNPKYRIQKKQGFTNWLILEEHTDIMIASERELQLQKEKGYKIDAVPYYKSIKSLTAMQKVGGNSAKLSGQLKEAARKAGKIVGKRHYNNKTGLFGMSEDKKLCALKNGGKTVGKKMVDSGLFDKVRSIANNTRYICPDGHVSNLAHYRAYCKRRGLDWLLAIKIENTNT